MDVRTRAQERNQDLEHGLHVKLSDDELVRQFTGKSLRSWRYLNWFYDTLINHSVILLKPGLTTQVTQGGDSGLLRQKKASQILDIIWQDENALLLLLEKTERVVTSTVKVVRSELDVLNTKVKVFGQFDPTMNPEKLHLQNVLRGIEEHLPQCAQ
jgi:hypothetical protein